MRRPPRLGAHDLAAYAAAWHAVAMDWLPYALVLAALAGFLGYVRRKNELFCVSVRAGRALVVRGRISPSLLEDLRDIVKGTERGTVRVVKHDRGALVVLDGAFDDRTAQKLRNTVSIVPPQRLRTAPPIARPTLGQTLGVAWLAWLLDSRR